MISMGKHSYNPTNDINCYAGVFLQFGNFCSVASGLKIHSGVHPIKNNPQAVSQFPFKEVWNLDYHESVLGGSVFIGNDVWIASDVSILVGVTIGNGVVIGAGSVVTKDIPAYSFVAGNPAKIRSFRFDWETIKKLEKMAWWNWDDEKIKEAVPYMKNIDGFINKYYTEAI